MNYDRVQIKQTAKMRIKQNDVPSIKQVTLVYLLLASLLPALVECFYSTITNNLSLNISNAYLNMDVDQVAELMQDYFLSNAGLIATGCSVLMGLFATVMGVGYYYYTVKVARNQPDAGYEDLTYGLEFVGKVILVAVLEFIYVFLWSCLFVIPGIVATYRYRLAYYALIDDPSISPLEAIRRSKQLMRGRKMDLFVLDLSFLGWSLLATACSTVGEWVGQTMLGNSTLAAYLVTAVLSFVAFLPLGLWLTAYMQLSEVYFYEVARSPMNQGGNPDNFGYGGYGAPNGYDWQNQPPQNQENGWNQPNQNEDGNNDPWN